MLFEQIVLHFLDCIAFYDSSFVVHILIMHIEAGMISVKAKYL